MQAFDGLARGQACMDRERVGRAQVLGDAGQREPSGVAWAESLYAVDLAGWFFILTLGSSACKCGEGSMGRPAVPSGAAGV